MVIEQTEILNAIRILPPAARLAIAEATLRSLREEFPSTESEMGSVPSWEERCRHLAEAAIEALPYYQADSELTIFTALDGEDFYEYEANMQEINQAIALVLNIK